LVVKKGSKIRSQHGLAHAVAGVGDAELEPLAALGTGTRFDLQRDLEHSRDFRGMAYSALAQRFTTT
jgi:hypothetical protein